jgi:hypothetical protein
MSTLRFIFFLSICLILFFSTPSAAEADREKGPSKELDLRGQHSGIDWKVRVDSAGRLLSFRAKHQSTIAPIEFEFSYEGTSTSPSAARLAGRAWRNREMSMLGNEVMAPACGKANKPLFKYASAIGTPANILQHRGWKKSQTPTSEVPLPLVKAWDPSDEGIDPDYDVDWLAFQQLQQFYNDLYFQQLLIDFGPKPTPREECLQACSTLKDWGLAACAALGMGGYVGAGMAVVCGLYILGKDADCVSSLSFPSFFVFQCDDIKPPSLALAES